MAAISNCPCCHLSSLHPVPTDFLLHVSASAPSSQGDPTPRFPKSHSRGWKNTGHPSTFFCAQLHLIFFPHVTPNPSVVSLWLLHHHRQKYLGLEELGIFTYIQKLSRGQAQVYTEDLLVCCVCLMHNKSRAFGLSRARHLACGRPHKVKLVTPCTALFLGLPFLI